MGSNDAAIAQKTPAQVSYMLQLAEQSGARKHAASQMSLLTNVMQKLVYARNDSVRRQSVLDDLARDVLGAQMCIFIPVASVRQAEGWDFTCNAKVRLFFGRTYAYCVLCRNSREYVSFHNRKVKIEQEPRKSREHVLQERALVMSVFDKVCSREEVWEETQGSLDNQDSFFGTTIAPLHLLGWPVQKADGELYGALAVLRTNIRPFSKLDKKIVKGVAKRLAHISSAARYTASR